jgi:hypothetical protein
MAWQGFLAARQVEEGLAVGMKLRAQGLDRLAGGERHALGNAVARIYRERALRAYRRWGAALKVRELESLVARERGG